MELRDFGTRSGIQVPDIGFGGYQIGQPDISKETACDLVNYYYEEAVSKVDLAYYDTARSYGKSEECMGYILFGLTPKPRDNFIIATKGHELNNLENFRVDFETSWDKLQIPEDGWIDVFQFHGLTPPEWTPNDAVVNYVKGLFDQGRVKHIGVTGGHLASELEWFAEEISRIDALLRDPTGYRRLHTIQVNFNIAQCSEGFIQFIAGEAADGYGIVIKKPLAKGIPINGYEAWELLDFILAHPDVGDCISNVIPGWKSRDEVDESLIRNEMDPLSEEKRAMLEEYGKSVVLPPFEYPHHL